VFVWMRRPRAIAPVLLLLLLLLLLIVEID
jgi:hypothetical protein